MVQQFPTVATHDHSNGLEVFYSKLSSKITNIGLECKSPTCIDRVRLKPYNISSKILSLIKFLFKNIGNLKRAKSSSLKTSNVLHGNTLQLGSPLSQPFSFLFRDGKIRTQDLPGGRRMTFQ